MQDRETYRSLLDLRQTVLEERSAYLLDASRLGHPAEDEFDERSHHFACTIDEQLVAACRFTPPAGEGWEASTLCPIPTALTNEAETLLQISRVVVRRDLRNMALTEVLLGMACRWLLSNTRFDAYFALCRPPLVRHYEHFGAVLLEGQDVIVPKRGRCRYSFVRGTLTGSESAIGDFLESRPQHPWRLVPIEPQPDAVPTDPTGPKDPPGPVGRAERGVTAIGTESSTPITTDRMSAPHE